MKHQQINLNIGNAGFLIKVNCQSRKWQKQYRADPLYYSNEIYLIEHKH